MACGLVQMGSTSVMLVLAAFTVLSLYFHSAGAYDCNKIDFKPHDENLKTTIQNRIKALAKMEPQKVVSRFKSSRSYMVAVCRKISDQAAAVTCTDGKDTKLLGQLEGPAVDGDEHGQWIMITYKVDAPKPANASQCVPEQHSSILIYCVPDMKKPEVTLLSDDTPSAPMFLIKTACSDDVSPKTGDGTKDAAATSGGATSAQTAKASSHLSGASIFFTLVIMAVIAYLTMGFLYKRYVVGAQGYEQIPNYLFWRQCYRRITGLCTGNSMGPISASANDTYRRYDADDLSFDQPPLVPSQDYQPVRVVAPNSPKDEADERLLQV